MSSRARDVGMTLPALRSGVGVLLVLSGVLMCAASWQRWAGWCGWGDEDRARCLDRQDHLYDFIAPSAPWQPVGDAAQLAGGSLLVLAVAFALLPLCMTGRRPGLLSTTAAVGAALASAVVGGATLRAGVTGEVVEAVPYAVALPVWLFLLPLMLVAWAVMSRGWALAAAVALFLASPLVAVLSYAVGPYDSQPWWEAISGLLIAAAGLCLLVAAAVMSPASSATGRLGAELLEERG